MHKRSSTVLPLLLTLTVLTAALGLWRAWIGRQQLAEQSRPAMTGASRSLAPDFTLTTLVAKHCGWLTCGAGGAPILEPGAAM
jgi:hypothetical protein